jgi:repressor LexA
VTESLLIWFGPRAVVVRDMTPAQARVFQFVVSSLAEVGYPPTLREVARHIGRGISSAQLHLEALARKGYLRRDPGTMRGIRLVRAPGMAGQ